MKLVGSLEGYPCDLASLKNAPKSPNLSAFRVGEKLQL